MKCKHCGSELVSVTWYVDASYLNTAGCAAYVPPQPCVPLSGWQSVEMGATIYVPNVAAAAAYVPSVWSAPLCQHEPESEYPNTTAGAS